MINPLIVGIAKLHHVGRDRGFHYSDTAIETSLTIKETAMYRYKTLVSNRLSLRSHDAQVAEMLVGVK